MSGVWERLARRVRGAVAPRPAAELRAYLPRLWPRGPQGPIDVTALRALSREYARSGRTLEDLFDDLDLLCDVVGIGTPSRVLEAGGAAWSDAFLDTVDPGAPSAELGEEPLREVEEQLAAHSSEAWGEVVGGRLLVVALPGVADPVSVAVSVEEEVAVVAAEVRRLFPYAALAIQPDLRRVVAAVAETEDLDRRLSQLEAFCAERAPVAPSVDTRPVPAQLDGARRILRAAG